MATQTQARLDPAIFRLPVDRIRQGYYSDAYFVYTKQTLEAEGHHPHVTMQVFQKKESVLGGIDEALAILKLCSGREDNGTWSEVQAYSASNTYTWTPSAGDVGDHAVRVSVRNSGSNGLGAGLPLAVSCARQIAACASASPARRVNRSARGVPASASAHAR